MKMSHRPLHLIFALLVLFSSHECRSISKQDDGTVMINKLLGNKTDFSILNSGKHFEGDILVSETANGTQSSAVYENRIWPGGKIPYIISNQYNQNERSIIEIAMNAFHEKTCIQFIPRTTEKDYISISKAGKGCCSFVGRENVGGNQLVSLDNGCVFPHIVKHELMHAVGFYHEQSRTDRDDHVIIHSDNIQRGMSSNFEKYDSRTVQLLKTPYDMKSIMHYEWNAFAQDPRRPTISAKNGANIDPSHDFTETDILDINRLYKCQTPEDQSTNPENPTLPWQNATVPYIISPSFSKSDRSIIARAMLEFHINTCIHFVPRTNQPDYVNIIPGFGCGSDVGRTGGGQPIILDTECVYVGFLIHELMHVIGFLHEHSRSDRDNYVTINWENIQDRMSHKFQKLSLDLIPTLGAEYDTDSVMHYGAFAFAKDPKRPTIVPKKIGAELGQRRELSKGDIYKINKLYKCNTKTPTVTQENSTELLPGSDCDNWNDYCDQWARIGECRKNAAYMKIYCPKACKLCRVSTDGLEESCADEHQDCASWAEKNQCKESSDYMLLNCKKSCGLC